MVNGILVLTHTFTRCVDLMSLSVCLLVADYLVTHLTVTNTVFIQVSMTHMISIKAFLTSVVSHRNVMKLKKPLNAFLNENEIILKTT